MVDTITRSTNDQRNAAETFLSDRIRPHLETIAAARRGNRSCSLSSPREH